MRPPIAHTLEQLDSIDSTNLYAMQRLQEGLAVHGSAFLARQQTAGRGQRGRQWWSPPDEQIALSVVLDTSKLATSQSFRLSATMALGAYDWLHCLYPSDWSIKWPNDLYHDDRKAGGILINNVVQGGRWNWSVVGIGINMNQASFPEDLPNPVSLFQLTGRRYDCADSALQLCSHLQRRWQQLEGGGWPDLIADYNNRLYGRNTVRRLRKDTAVIPCLIRRVNDQGMLLAGDNEEWVFAHGEVSWLPPGE